MLYFLLIDVLSMNLYIHLATNLDYFRLLNEGFLLSLWKEQEKQISNFFATNFPGELEEILSSQYNVNFESLKQLKKHFWQDVFKTVNWIYYWSDNCEYLIPTTWEIKQAISLFNDFNSIYPPHTSRTFTLVTPYTWNKMLWVLEKTLDYLNTLKLKTQIEVVVNDYWVLRLLETKYTNLKPIFWRLIHKLLKTPLIDTYWYSVHPSGDLIKNKDSTQIQELKEKITKWQMKFYSSSEVSLETYRNFLLKHWVTRVAIDYMSTRKELYKNVKNKEIWIDLYYPWALVFTWRLCDTSAIEHPSKWYYSTDDICSRTCNRYDISYKIKTNDYNLLQRGNSWYRSEVNLDLLDKEFINLESSRLIFSPFVTV